jgi:hypothetical protein
LYSDAVAFTPLNTVSPAQGYAFTQIPVNPAPAMIVPLVPPKEKPSNISWASFVLMAVDIVFDDPVELDGALAFGSNGVF